MARRKRPKNVTLEPTYLAAWRKHRKLTLRDVSQRIGIDPTAISRLERRQTPYDQVHLQQLSGLYDVSIPDLLYKDPERPRPTEEIISLVAKLDRPADITATRMFLETMLSRR
jgi:transcriptional regulator with XRE-family HTH domain